MPLITIPLEELARRLGREMKRPEIEPLLDQLGCDVEDFTEMRQFRCRTCASVSEWHLHEDIPKTCGECGSQSETAGAQFEDLGTLDVVRIDALPVRPDIFDPGGLVRALRGLLGDESGAPSYDLGPPHYTVHVDPAMSEPESYRPHIRCAVLRGLKFNDTTLRQVMKLQELLHWALGRDRKLASIGIYDLKGLKRDIFYKPIDPEGFTFVPLQSTDGKAVTPKQILEEHPKGVAYAHLLKDLKRYPCLVDEAGQVLSMPPIINSEDTRLTVESTEAFVDVTGLSERSVTKALNTVVTSMLELLPSATAEQVMIASPAGPGETMRAIPSPSLRPQKVTVDIAAACRLIGIRLSPQDAASLLTRMRHDVKILGSTLEVEVPAYRNDIMHEVDLIEDMAMSFGYDNIPPQLVPSMTVAERRPEQVLADRTRRALIGLGYYEAMSLLLTNADDQYIMMGTEDPGDAVVLDNPISVDQTMMRTSILPQLLKLFAHNRGQGLPQKFFEVDDVVRILKDVEQPEERLHVAAGLLAGAAGFADIKALVESLSRELGMPIALRASQNPAFLPGRSAAIYHRDLEVGVCGEVHPSLLEKLRLTTPLVVMEMDLGSCHS